MKPIITLIEPPALGMKLTSPDGENFELPTIRTHHPKLTLEILAGALKGMPCEVQVVDMKMFGTGNVIYKTFEHDGLKYECRRVGASFEQIREVVESSDVVGISSPFTQAAQIVADLGRYIKQVNRNVRLVIGGYDTLTDDRAAYYLKNGFDQVIPRRGEVELPHWIASQFDMSLPSIPPSSVLLDGLARSVCRLRFPLPDLSKVDYHSYIEIEDGKLPKGANYPTEYFVSSRGCDRSCEFCAIWHSSEGAYEVMAVEDVASLLDHFKSHGITTLMHAESNTLARLRYDHDGRENLLEIFRLMREQGFAWEFFDGIEFGRLADENGCVDGGLVDLLFHPEFRGGRLIGGYRAYIPVETARIERYSKLPSLDVQDRIFEAIVKSGVTQLSFGLIVGFPDESRESIEQLRRRAEQLRTLVEKASEGRTKSIFILYIHTLFPGSVNYRRLHGSLTVDITENPEMFQLYSGCKQAGDFSPSEITLLRRKLDRELNGDEIANYSEKTGRAPALLPSF